MFNNILLLVFPAVMIFAALMDIFTMTIPNKVSLALLIGFVVVAPFSGLPLQQIGMHLLAGLLVLAITIAMFSKGLVGGGDAKLLSAAALWIGFDLLLTFIAVVGVFGGLLAVAILFYRKVIPEVWVVKQKWAARLHEAKSGIPYGVAIAAGAVWIYPETEWFSVLSAFAG